MNRAFTFIPKIGQTKKCLQSVCKRNFSDPFGPSPGVAKKSFFRQGPISWASFILCVVASGGALTLFQIQKDKKLQEQSKKVETTGKAAVGGEWVLVNSEGEPVTDASYKGQFTLLYFGFTYCPDICPNELVKIGKIVDDLKVRMAKKQKKSGVVSHNFNLKPVFISVDPARDSVDQLKYYAKDFHPEIDWLTGTIPQIATISKAFRVYFSKANQHEDDEDDYLVDHSIVLYLMTPDNEFVEFYTQRMLVNEIVDKIEAHMIDYYEGSKDGK